ncbi:GspH/FimT family pseudopilin [Alteromonas sp. ASW11-36]|uniref:Type II secretion system protein H n=1 Tax=Alteromonas arenosi TaxID=3055817 RepID=A0ABT7SU74_9ALTE|nr:GspH/FimT family pseudopilin [Alteromonas sp. ASW11-36]MDM7859747.1 GspH/FimT family pseudopilin [Alteromonas sp. ASW11-36]
MDTTKRAWFAIPKTDKICVCYAYDITIERVQMRCQNGVTLLEMMITVAIVAIVLTTVAPSIQSILVQNRIIGEINELSGIIQFARHSAIDEQTNTVVCPTEDYTNCTNNWDNAKMVFMDLDANGMRGANEVLLVASSVINRVNDMTGPAGGFAFLPSGAASANATILLCHQNNNNEYARALTISLQGRVKMSADNNNDGIHEDTNGTALDCS